MKKQSTIFLIISCVLFYPMTSRAILVAGINSGVVTYCKEPAIIIEKRTEFKNKIAQAENSIKNIQNKLIDKYNYLLAEIDDLINIKNNEFLLENNVENQAKLTKYIDSLKSIKRNLDFKQNRVFNGSSSNEYFYEYYGGVSRPLNYTSDTQISFYYEFKDDATIQKYKEKIDEMINYKTSLDEEYNLVIFRSDIKSLAETIAHYTEILKEEIIPCCSSWVYSDWSACVNNQQTRTIASSQSSNCTGGNPVLNQSCNSTPLCTENNWTSTLTPTNCPDNGQQTKKWTKVGECQGGVSRQAEETISCNIQLQAKIEGKNNQIKQAQEEINVNKEKIDSTVKIENRDNKIQKEIQSNSQSNQKINPKQDNSVSLEKESVEKQEKENEKTKEAKEEEKDKSGVNAPEQKRSVVADTVQEIIKVADRNTNVGQQIKIIAQTQTQNQEKIETGMQKIQGRSGFVKFFVGPDYGEIKNSQKLLEQNKEQIQKLNKLGTQLPEKIDQQKISGQIKILEQENQQMEISLSEAKKGFSLFGWTFRLFAK